jgi:hypothetical protein
MTCLGIDYGTRMLKAATAASGRAAPEALPLADEHGQDCLPAIGRSVDGPLDPWALLLNHLVEPGVAAWLRDRLLTPTDVVGGAGGRQEAVAWHASVLAGLQRTLAGLEPPAGGLPTVIAVPDHWPTAAPAAAGPGAVEAWALPQALGEIGWSPLALVRESAAVLATWAPSPRRPLALLSLGAGPARLTVWNHERGRWTPGNQGVVQLPAVSGDILRRRIGQFVCDEIVRSQRRDPAEHAHEDQQVQNGVEVLLDAMRRDGDGIFQGRLFDQGVVIPVSRATMLDCCRSFREDLARALATIGPAVGNFDLLCWGELTLLLPLHEWLVEVDGITELEMASFHAVAGGAARIAALLGEGDLAFEAALTADPASGQIRPAGHGIGIPLIETVPGDLLPPGARVEAWVVDADTGRRHLIGQQLRVGRDPKLEVSFSQAEFPEVSRHHFTIFRVGEEFELHDNASSNGTYVNGEARRTACRLVTGDKILAGPNGPCLVFEVDRS